MPCPGEYLRLHPLPCERCAETKKYGPNERTDQSSKNSDEERANLSDAQFKTLVIKMLQGLTGYFNSIKKTQAAMKIALCEIRKLYRKPTVTGRGRKPGLKSKVWSRKKHSTRTE